MSHGPVEKQHRAKMNALAHTLNEILHPYGFALLVFEMGDEPKTGRMNYISNAERRGMVKAMRELANKMEAEFGEEEA